MQIRFSFVDTAPSDHGFDCDILVSFSFGQHQAILFKLYKVDGLYSCEIESEGNFTEEERTLAIELATREFNQKYDYL